MAQSPFGIGNRKSEIGRRQNKNLLTPTNSPVHSSSTSIESYITRHWSCSRSRWIGHAEEHYPLIWFTLRFRISFLFSLFNSLQFGLPLMINGVCFSLNDTYIKSFWIRYVINILWLVLPFALCFSMTKILPSISRYINNEHRPMPSDGKHRFMCDSSQIINEEGKKTSGNIFNT